MMRVSVISDWNNRNLKKEDTMQKETVILPCLHDWKLNEWEERFVQEGGGILVPSQYWNDSVHRASTTKEHTIPYSPATMGGMLLDQSEALLVWRPVQKKLVVTLEEGFECLRERITFSSTVLAAGKPDVEAVLSFEQLRVQHPGYRIMAWSNIGPPLAQEGRWRRAKPLEVIASLLGLFLSDKQPDGVRSLSDCYLLACSAQGGKMCLNYVTNHEQGRCRLWVLKPELSVE